MINKRLLIKNLLAHNDENSFYDKKRQLNIGEKEGKAKFLKHICALSNSNPKNSSYIVIGVRDEDNKIIGVDFFDDSKIQNLVNAYLQNPPLVSYENIPFPHLPADKVVGLVTIKAPDGKLCALRKNIWKYYGGTVFFRDGSISMPKVFESTIKDVNSEVVSAIESHAQNNIELTLDAVFDFMNSRTDYSPQYKVFKEYFVVCWSAREKMVDNQLYYSRVDIELINEQVRLFYSQFDEVSIRITDSFFEIIEYVQLGFQEKFQYYPLEKVVINFRDNASYDIENELLFEPPQFDRKILHHLYNSNQALLEKLRKNIPLQKFEQKDVLNLPATYLLCFFNGFEEAIDQLEEAKPLLKNFPDIRAYNSYKESLRILRKVKYSS